MKAEDTIINDEQINKVEDIWLHTNWNNDNEFPRMIAKAQAEVSFRAGIKEVIEWIKSHSQLEQCDPDTMAYFTDYYAIEKSEWQSKLEEWDI